MNEPAAAEALIDSAVAHWRRAGGDEAVAALGWCLSAAVGLKLRLGKLAEATQVVVPLWMTLQP
jgi:signal recognition particle subunit SRP72